MQGLLCNWGGGAPPTDMWRWCMTNMTVETRRGRDKRSLRQTRGRPFSGPVRKMASCAANPRAITDAWRCGEGHYMRPLSLSAEKGRGSTAAHCATHALAPGFRQPPGMAVPSSCRSRPPPPAGSSSASQLLRRMQRATPRPGQLRLRPLSRVGIAQLGSRARHASGMQAPQPQPPHWRHAPHSMTIPGPAPVQPPAGAYVPIASTVSHCSHPCDIPTT